MTWRCCIVHLVDEDPSALQRTAQILGRQDFAIERWSSPTGFLSQVGTLTPGCVVIDMLAPTLDIWAAAHRLDSLPVPLPWIVLTDIDSRAGSIEAMRAGAIDVLLKPADDARLVAGIARGRTRIVEARRALAERQRLAALLALLTLRETEVLAGLARGQSNKGIARDLGISDRTVEVHRAGVMQKLGAPSFADALRIAFDAERAIPGILSCAATPDWRDPPAHATMAQTEEDRPWLPPSPSAPR